MLNEVEIKCANGRQFHEAYLRMVYIRQDHDKDMLLLVLNAK